jgi:transmembrane sensor
MKENFKEEKHDKFWKLAAKLLNGSGNEKDNISLSEILLKDKELLERYDFIKEHWAVLKELKVFSQIPTEEDWLKVKNKIEKNKYSNTYLSSSEDLSIGGFAVIRRILPYAAAIVILVVVTYIFAAQPFRNPVAFEQPTQIHSQLGSKVQVELPDGTIVWLNAGSKLSFDPSFNHGNRDVRLLGEAFFEVNQGSLPFVVNTDRMQITALGTSFNVNAYASDVYSSSTLMSGKLQLVLNNPGKNENDEIILYPGNKVIVERTSDGTYAYQMIDMRTPEIEIAWKEGIIYIDNESLGELAVRLERQYDVSFIFETDDVKNYIYSGRLKQLSIEQILNALRLTSPIDFSIDEKNVYISMNATTKDLYMINNNLRVNE